MVDSAPLAVDAEEGVEASAEDTTMDLPTRLSVRLSLLCAQPSQAD